MGVASPSFEPGAGPGPRTSVDRDTLRRHDLLRVAPEAWSEMLSHRPDAADVPLVRGWAANGWPVVVRRLGSSDGPGDIPVALPLPPHLGKLRIALTLLGDSIIEAVASVSLGEAAADAPAAWQETLRKILEIDASCEATAHPPPRSGGGGPPEAVEGAAAAPILDVSSDRIRLARSTRPPPPPPSFGWSPSPASRGRMREAGPRVFGALLWQHLTGLPYLHAGSDLDLIWSPRDAAAARDLVDRLQSIEASAPMALDGEIETSGGGGVNWRELARATADGEVLVKHLLAVRLQTVSRLFESSPA